MQPLSTTNSPVARPVDDLGQPLPRITIPDGQTTVTFNVQAADVTTPSTATINGVPKGVKLTVK